MTTCTHGVDLNGICAECMSAPLGAKPVRATYTRPTMFKQLANDFFEHTDGKIISMVVFEGEIYVATDIGVFKLNRHDVFEPLSFVEISA